MIFLFLCSFKTNTNPFLLKVFFFRFTDRIFILSADPLDAFSYGGWETSNFKLKLLLTYPVLWYIQNTSLAGHPLPSCPCSPHSNRQITVTLLLDIFKVNPLSTQEFEKTKVWTRTKTDFISIFTVEKFSFLQVVEK